MEKGEFHLTAEPVSLCHQALKPITRHLDSKADLLS